MKRLENETIKSQAYSMQVSAVWRSERQKESSVFICTVVFFFTGHASSVLQRFFFI